MAGIEAEVSVAAAAPARPLPAELALDEDDAVADYMEARAQPA